MKDTLPTHYRFEAKHKEPFIRAVETLGEALRQQGPLDLKTMHLVQLAGSVAIRSEGGVHSHVRQALASGRRAMKCIMRSFCSRAQWAFLRSPRR